MSKMQSSKFLLIALCCSFFISTTTIAKKYDDEESAEETMTSNRPQGTTFRPFTFWFTMPTIPQIPPNLNPMLDQDCLSCICKASTGNCAVSAGCSPQTGFCGPYQLSRTFYQDECLGLMVGNVINITIPFVLSSSPALQQQDFERCARDKLCSERCISRYMLRNNYSCRRGYTPTCGAFQRLPFGGQVQACNSQMAQSFWNEVVQCYERLAVTPAPPQPTRDYRLPTMPTVTPRPPVVIETPGNNELVSRDCLDCLCQAESNCDEKIGCQGSVCGPYGITWSYYLDCQIDGGGYARCVNDKACAELCVQRYMAKFAPSCLGFGSLEDTKKNATCQDYARIHRGGLYGCRLPSTLDFWNKNMKTCFEKKQSAAATSYYLNSRLSFLTLSFLYFLLSVYCIEN